MTEGFSVSSDEIREKLFDEKQKGGRIMRTMQGMLKTSHSTQLVPLETFLLEEGKIYITDTITDESANLFTQQIMYLEQKYQERPIHIYINSSGGVVEAGLAMRDMIKGLEKKGIEVNIYCIQMAASMATILLASGPKGHRRILKSSKTMVHEPLISGGVSGSATTIQKTAESIMNTKCRLVKLLAEDTGRSLAEIEEAIFYDHFMNAEESVEFGLCDEVIDYL